MAEIIISRSEAKTKGLDRYFTGKPCKHGHITKRKTVNGTCLTCHEETLTKWRLDNVERIREADRAHRRKTSATHNERTRLWRIKNSEQAKARDKAKYQRTDREVLRKHRRDRKARQKGASGSHAVEELRDLLEKQKFKCAEPTCEKSIRQHRHLDHIQPLIKGGSNDIKNLQWLCPQCNLRKHSKDPIDWARQNGRLI